MLSLLPDCARLNAEKGAFSTRSRVESCQRRLNPVALSVLSHGKNYDCHCPRCGPGAKDAIVFIPRCKNRSPASPKMGACMKTMASLDIFGARATTRAMTIIIFAMTENWESYWIESPLTAFDTAACGKCTFFRIQSGAIWRNLEAMKASIW